jgi:hypothetical protein
MGYFVKSRQLQSGSTGIVLPSGNTVERPVSPLAGLFRYNTDTAGLEFYNGVSYEVLGTASSITYIVDNFMGNGVAYQFIMSEPVISATSILVFVGSIYQPPGVYSVDGSTTITFSEPPPDELPFNVIHSYV